MKPNSSGRVTLVGAGPGDPELITIKGLKALKTADVVLYDALVDEELLSFTPSDCIKVYVGKRNGCHHHSQESINKLLLFYAQRFREVVRLKGGDPFVFGRGYEESVYLQAHNIEVAVVPGISSAVAAPASAGVPVTLRGVSESFWVLTATNASHKLPQDLTLAAQSSATVVILMGLSKLKEIVDIFSRTRSLHEPIAIIQHATKKNQSTIIGSLHDIVAIASARGAESPAVIVIGPVINHASVNEILVQHSEEIRRAV